MRQRLQYTARAMWRGLRGWLGRGTQADVDRPGDDEQFAAWVDELREQRCPS